MNPPPKRPASVASTSRRREKSLPPSAGRLHKQTTGEGPKIEEKASTVAAEQPEETPVEITDIQNQSQKIVNPSEEVASAEAPTEVTEVTLEVEAQESEDGCQSPTTTTSSTTLVHEGEGKDDDEILAKE